MLMMIANLLIYSILNLLLANKSESLSEYKQLLRKSTQSMFSIVLSKITLSKVETEVCVYTGFYRNQQALLLF